MREGERSEGFPIAERQEGIRANSENSRRYGASERSERAERRRRQADDGANRASEASGAVSTDRRQLGLKKK